MSSSDQGESSSRKKQRLSSPTYDEQYELSLGQIQAFDALDKTISQHTSLSPKSPPKQSQANTPRSRRRRNLAIAMALKENVPKDDMNNVSTAPLRDGSSDGNVQKPKGSQTASDLPSQMKHSEFGSALNVALINSEEKGSPSSSPDISPEPDLAAWFASSDIPSVGFASARALVEDRNSEWLTAPAPAGIAGFQSAKSVRMPVISDPEISDANASYLANAGELEEAPAFTGFTTGSNLLQPGKGSATILMPSAEALAKAAKRLAQWDREFDDEVEDTSIIAELQEDAGTSFSGFSSAAGAFRPALIVAQNSPDKIPPSTPTPAGTSSARSFSPLVHRGPFDKKLEFKPPLLTAFPSRVRQASNNIIGSSVNPKRAAESRGFTAPARVAGPSTPVRRTAPLSSPKKSLGVTPRHAVGGSLQKPTFSTPFKTGIKPGDFGRLAPAAKPSANSAVRIIGSGNTKPAVAGSSNLLLTKSKGKQRAAYIDLLGSGDRQSLATCGLRPQTYDAQELEAMGM
ncbi:hypothetical protein BC835DRAFT_1414750 [Cytidiella melzeri]|nr:hypothetical protein BC835DRAFT_1414750 [Cytidiella melzeri]